MEKALGEERLVSEDRNQKPDYGRSVEPIK